MAIALPEARSVAVNPTQAEMRGWVLEHMPRITETEFGNLNYKAQVKARLAASTFFIVEEENYQNRMSRAEYNEWAAKQDAYIADKDMILIEGYIGPDPDFQTASAVYMERTQANIPAMQQQLYFPKDENWDREFTVIYTPGLPAPGKSNDRLILVDHENYVTRVFGSDYFGESKMGGLRMWNHLVYQRGGLALHSGLKTFPDIDGEEKVAIILGLSGTGKTTTTFRQQLGSLPVQDDFNAIMPGGLVYTTENGCFAKTFGLDADDEPTIYGGTTRPDAWLENTHCDPDGKVDFFDDSDTANGRSTFGLDHIRHRSPLNVPPANYMLLLNRNENLIPAVAKLKREQAAAYFMLGETKGTSAGGAGEEGKNLRVPGTNPFFFDNDALQGNRLLELLDTMPDLDVYLMNTGRVGGVDGDERSKKVKIKHSSAVVTGIVSGTIEWEEDPDFGYFVAKSLPDFPDFELLRPYQLYERQGRLDEYAAIVESLTAERREYLRSYPGLDSSIVNAI
ncbi:MAG: phosphoenolpyruvate carboxykinase [bacterium]|nr:phosphoenolpyruvate carboxykinase [bacterium]MCP4966454.1 phosphoenolpyruvate carboxykinase [bacterium]